uniref:Uncharacterized protein n=1 Tax=Utricularia reniformis TaxID=192314 RepID=A0A1Y0B365_9LAMI|nr:hypothetical protein AEK19_MT1654 [Utricularia reniformis]ART31838.1 hypothetical protein AEK19_MT1654 [Utricularia reniformis]
MLRPASRCILKTSFSLVMGLERAGLEPNWMLLLYFIF